jgi:hypothetical protein
MFDGQTRVTLEITELYLVELLGEWFFNGFGRRGLGLNLLDGQGLDVVASGSGKLAGCVGELFGFFMACATVVGVLIVAAKGSSFTCWTQRYTLYLTAPYLWVDLCRNVLFLTFLLLELLSEHLDLVLQAVHTCTQQHYLLIFA